MSRSHRVRPAARPFAWPLSVGLLLVLAARGGISAQNSVDLQTAADWSDAIPAHVAIVDGDAQLERDGGIENAVENVPLLSGDRLTTRRGRAEVLFADGSVLDLDQYSSVDLVSGELLRLAGGRLRLTIVRAASPIAYRVDAAGTMSLIGTSGEYRVEVADERALDPEVRLTVLRGNAELRTDEGRTLVRAGYEARATARLAPSVPYIANVSAVDDFERWILARRDDRVGVSAQYLPAELRYYGGAFDRDGWWGYEPTVGYAWYPRVAADWHPYYDGGWSFIGAFGWTWVGGGARWGWPTHHYGRWGFSTAGWYWIPGRHWAPAWVSWASAPGYVGWCPLGWNNRPVVAVTQINVYGNRPWHGWTVLPDRSFAGGYATPRTLANSRSLPLVVGSRFVGQPDGPAQPGIARASAAPLRAPATLATRSATPRSSSLSEPPSQESVRRGAESRARVVTPTGSIRTMQRVDTGNVTPRAREQAVPRPLAMTPWVDRGSDPANAQSAPVRYPPARAAAPRERGSSPPAYAPSPVAPAQDRPPYARRRLEPPAPAVAPSPAPSDRPLYGRSRIQSAPPTDASGQPPAASRPSGGSVARSRNVPAPSAPAPQAQNPPAAGVGVRPARTR